MPGTSGIVAPLVSPLPGQCVLFTDVNLLTSDQNLWLDNLYIRHHSTARTDTGHVVGCYSKDCNLWMTSVTLQGDGVSDPWAQASGMAIVAGQVYAEGVLWFRRDATARFCVLTRKCLKFPPQCWLLRVQSVLVVHRQLVGTASANVDMEITTSVRDNPRILNSTKHNYAPNTPSPSLMTQVST